jgi:hypothetical protein
VGGLAGGISLYFAQRLFDWYKRPILEIDREMSPIPVMIHLDSGVRGVSGGITLSPLRRWLSKIYGTPTVSGDITLDRIPYVVNRVRVMNRGKSAAENCKAILVVNDQAEKVSWHIARERYVMTINSQDWEYVDLCAVCATDIQALITSSRPIGAGTEGIQALTENDVRWRIAPTEEGWQTPIRNNRDLGHHDIECTLRITAKNTDCAEARIRIREQPDNNGRIVHFL